MKTPRIVDAMNYIDDDLVSWAVEYRPAKRKVSWFRYVSIAACLCLIVFGAIRFSVDLQPHTNTDTTEYGILGEVLEVLENGQYKVKITGEDQNFANGNIVILTPGFSYVTEGLEESYLKTGDIIAVTYSEFSKTEKAYEITPNQIEIIQ